jgi:hypothetical protein
MNRRSVTSSIRRSPGSLFARAILGLFLVGTLLLAGAGSVGLLRLESAPTTVGFINPVMPMLPVVTVLLLNIHP